MSKHRERVTIKVERNHNYEWEVVVRRNGMRDEACCYYCDDKDDAVNTARAMIAREAQLASEVAS